MPHSDLNYLRTKTSRFDVIDAIMNSKPADLILENGKLVNVYTRQVYEADVTIYGDRIGFIGDASNIEASKRLDLKGKYITPGLMDGHLHIDSCMVNVTNFAKGVLPLGVTSVFIDSHEIGNALGIEGVKMMVDEGKNTPLRVFQYVPAQVPCGAPENQTPNEYIGLDETKQLYGMENIFGLGEVSKYRVVRLDPYFLEKIEWVLKQGGVVDGSAHDFTGKELQAYVASGIFADHESISKEIALERAQNGLTVMMRQGSTQQDVDKCIKAVVESGADPTRFCFCCDDRHPVDLVRQGSIDYCIKLAIREGVDPITAVQMATINCARNFRLDGELGGLAPGKIADILVVSDLKNFNPELVYVGGELVAEKGEMKRELKSPDYSSFILSSFKADRKITPEDMEICLDQSDASGDRKFNIIKAIPNNIWSGWEKDVLPVVNGKVQLVEEKGIIKIVVVERYGKTSGPNIGKGLITGFGFLKGAIAQSLAQDKHDIVAMGSNDADMAIAINKVFEMNGGLVAVQNGVVLGTLPLPIAGLMCDRSVQEVSRIVNELSQLARDKMGCIIEDPYACLQFQTHPMIPYLKISDLGLMDINNQKLISILAES